MSSCSAGLEGDQGIGRVTYYIILYQALIRTYPMEIKFKAFVWREYECDLSPRSPCRAENFSLSQIESFSRTNAGRITAIERQPSVTNERCNSLFTLYYINDHNITSQKHHYIGQRYRERREEV